MSTQTPAKSKGQIAAEKIRVKLGMYLNINKAAQIIDSVIDSDSLPAGGEEWTYHYALRSWSIVSGPKHISVGLIFDPNKRIEKDVKNVVEFHNATLRRTQPVQGLEQIAREAAISICDAFGTTYWAVGFLGSPTLLLNPPAQDPPAAG